MSQQFKTTFRGAEIEVLMTVRSMHPPKFEIVFLTAIPKPKVALTREEMAALAREASRVARLREKDA